MTTQICIATGQPLANLIPILHFKPRKVLVIATDSMKQAAKNFKKILNDLDVEDVSIVDACPDTDLIKISEFLTAKLAKQLPQEGCTFNLTGGTKLHSFSMYEVFKQRNNDDKFIYIDTNNRLIEYYPSKNQHSFNEPLSSILTAEMTLKGMGKKFISAESNDENWQKNTLNIKELTYFIAENIEDSNIKQLIRGINGFVSEIYNGGKINRFREGAGKLHSQPKGLAIDLLKKADNAGVVNWHGGANISFDNYNQARYLSGIWLEQYVWLVAHKIGFEELYSGLKFGNNADNEIDLFIQHQNMALAIECKSAASISRSNDVSQDMFHKLNSVANRASGSLCTKLFVSAFPLKTKNGNDLPSVNHAREQDIKIVQTSDIVKQLPTLLKNWKDKGKLVYKLK